MRIGRKALGFKSVDSWQSEITDGLIHKKAVSRTRFEDVRGNFNGKSVRSFW